MNPQDSLFIVNVIKNSTHDVIKAIDASKSITIKDTLPMIGVVTAATVAACIAIWSLKRNMKFEREKRKEDGKRATLQNIQKIYGELVGVHNLWISDIHFMNGYCIDSFYYYHLARVNENLNNDIDSQYKIYNDKYLNKYDQLVDRNQKYMALVGEYLFISESKQVAELVQIINNRSYDFPFDGNIFKGMTAQNMAIQRSKMLEESKQFTEKEILTIGNKILAAMIEEKHKYN